MTVIEKLNELNDKYDKMQNALDQSGDNAFVIGVLTGAIIAGSLMAIVLVNVAQ